MRACLGLVTLASALAMGGSSASIASADECRVLNVPRLDPKPEAERTWIGDRHGQHLERSAIAWLGRFGENDDYAEVRAIYDADGLDLTISVTDLYLWWILTDGVQFGGELRAEPLDWDAIDIAIDPTPSGHQPSANALRVLVANYSDSDPVGYPETALPHLATRTWMGGAGAWTSVPDAVSAGHVWYNAVQNSWTAAQGPNDNYGDLDGGTVYHVFVPWASLGTTEPPSGGTMRMIVTVRDVDDPRDSDVTQGSSPTSGDSLQVGPLPTTTWPDRADGDDPSTWATLVMHQAPYAAPEVSASSVSEITSDDVPTMDVTVGGHSFLLDRWTSGGGDPDAFAETTCMDTHFAERPDLVVRPGAAPENLCYFSRALLMFDLAGVVPVGDAITHADLVMVHSGSDTRADAGSPDFDALTSSMQVHRLEGKWTDAPLEQSVTWNTAPFAAENVGLGTVTPDVANGGSTVTFDVTPMVALAVARGEPLDLALYGADTRPDSGKLFHSREGGASVDERPRLRITHGPALDPSKLPDPAMCTLGVSASLFDPQGTGFPESPIAPVPSGSEGGGGAGGAAATSSTGAAAPPGDEPLDDGCSCHVVNDRRPSFATIGLVATVIALSAATRRRARRQPRIHTNAR